MKQISCFQLFTTVFFMFLVFLKTIVTFTYSFMLNYYFFRQIVDDQWLPLKKNSKNLKKSLGQKMIFYSKFERVICVFVNI